MSSTRTPTITVARQAGACYGVERALHMVNDAAQHDAKVRTLGPLIHNPKVVADLAHEGIAAVDDLSDVEDDATVVIRSHGVVPSVIEEAQSRGLDVLDATCPHVKKAHDAARFLNEQGYQVVIVGEPGHPEVEGILGNAGPHAIVVDDPQQLNEAKLSKRVGVVVQTTQTRALLTEIVDALLPRVFELRVFSTICEATMRRQRSADELARHVDAMIVVGGKNSGNTTRLAQICAAVCPNTHHIESASELCADWFADVLNIGVTAGASTPADQIDSVCNAIVALTGAVRS